MKIAVIRKPFPRAASVSLRAVQQGWRTFGSAPAGDAKRTALYDTHTQLQGKIVNFAGYDLPVQYNPESVLASHEWVRKSSGLFDVSHMGQLRITGEKRLQFLESLVPSDLLALKENQSQLSTLLNEKGGILDDCMITNKKDHVYMVVNAGCKDADLVHMRAKLKTFNASQGADVAIEYIQNRSLMALQGPKSAEVLARLIPSTVDLKQLKFTYTQDIKVDGADCWVARLGYTGEDGFEISVPNAAANALFKKFCSFSEVHPAGLAVRDSLRLEAGLCLYGHDLNDSITPVEAGLLWIIGKRRREQGGFPGYDVIAKQIKEGVARKRVGLEVLGGAPAREHTEILADDKTTQIGVVTSGTFSPTLKKSISMGYVKSSHAKADTPVAVKVRGKVNPAKIVKMPFVPQTYYRGP